MTPDLQAGRLSMRMRLSAVVLAAGAVAATSLGTTVPSHAATPAPRYTLVLGPMDSGEYLGINNNGDIIGIGVDQQPKGGRKASSSRPAPPRP